MVENKGQIRKRNPKLHPLLMKPKEIEELMQRQNELFQNNYIHLKINKCVYCRCEDVPNLEIDVRLFSETKTVLSLKVRGAKCEGCGHEYFSKGSEVLIARVKVAMDEPLPKIT